MRASQVVLGWVREGVNLFFINDLPLIWCRQNKPVSYEQWCFTDKEISNLLTKKAIRVALVTPLGISSIKVAAKKSLKKFHLCLDMHWLGKFIKIPKF
jgi:hypothetical protein